MLLHLLKRLMFVLAAFAILGGAAASPMRAVAAQAVMAAGDDCPAMKMHMPCPAAKSGACKMAASDCVKAMACCDSLPGAMIHRLASVVSPGGASISYGEIPAALHGRTAEPALFPPRAV